MEAALTLEEVQITEQFKKTVLWQYQAEAQILEAQQTQVSELKEVNRIDPSIEVEESFVEFPFSKIVGLLTGLIFFISIRCL